jgi:hypothetical protein
MKRWGLRLLQVVLLILVAWGIYRVLGPQVSRLTAEDLLHYQPSVTLLLLSSGLLLMFYFLQAWLWRMIAVALSGTSLSIRAAMKVFFLSGLGRYLPGKGLQFAGYAVLAQREGFSPVAATAASLVAMLAFLTSGVVFLALLLPTLLKGAAALGAIGLLVFGVAVFAVAVTKRGKALRHNLLSRLSPRTAQAGALLDRMTARDAFIWWLYFGLSWIVLGAAFALFVISFVPQQAAEYRQFAGIAAASYLFGYIMFTPAGIGTREASIMALLHTVSNVPVPAALLISILSRIWFTAGELLPLAALPLLTGSTHRTAGREGQ